MVEAVQLRVGFAGSPDFAARILSALVDSKFSPELVLTQPDRPKGRGRKLIANPVKTLAKTGNIEVLQPVSLRNPPPELTLRPLDVLIVAAYGLILPRAILDWPTLGCINVHASLLPRWRGAAPIERAVMAGDAETGVCIMAMEAGLDTGPVYQAAKLPMGNGPIDMLELERNLADLGASCLIDVLRRFAHAKAASDPLPQPVAQPEAGVTYADKLTARDRQVDWSQPADNIARQVTALSARLPVRVRIADLGMQLLSATAEIVDTKQPPGHIVKLDAEGLCVSCANSLLRITRVKLEGGKGQAINAKDLRNGYGDVLTADTVVS